MRKNSRNKGSRFERTIAKAWESWTGYKFSRTPGSGGWAKAKDAMGDLVCTDEKHSRRFPFSIECKNYQEIKDVSDHQLRRVENLTEILNEFEIKSLQPCPKCGHQPIIRELPNGGYKIVCRVCDLTTGLFNHKQNLINYWNTAICEEAVRYLQMDYESMFDREKE